MATGRGFTPGGANGGRCQWRTAERGKRPGRVYKGAGGRLKGRGVNHVAGASGVGNKALRRAV
jgi:hypothetical protein